MSLISAATLMDLMPVLAVWHCFAVAFCGLLKPNALIIYLSLSVSLSRYHSTQLLKHLSSIDWRDYDARTCLCMSDVLFISRMFATRQRSEEFCKSCKSLFTILMVAQQQ